MPLARVSSARPEPVSALEFRPRVRLPASEPAVIARTVTSPVAVAAIAVAPPSTERRAFEEVAVTSRLSW